MGPGGARSWSIAAGIRRGCFSASPAWARIRFCASTRAAAFGPQVCPTGLDEPSTADREAFRRAAGGWKETVDADTLINNIYESRLLSTRPVPKL